MPRYITVMHTAGGDIPLYVGPGDVVSGALGWWGLRAYSAATAGTVAINLRRDSDNAAQDFSTLANGKLDVASIAGFKGAANLFVTKLYDQTGNGRTAAQTTAVNQFPFTLSALGSLPALDNSAGTSTLSLDTAASITQAQPFTFSAVCNRTNSADRWLVASLDIAVTIDRNLGANNTVSINAGTWLSTAGIADSTWHALQMLLSSTSSQIYSDGSAIATGDASTAGLASTGIQIGNVAFATAFYGYIGEVGFWGSDISSSFSALNSNQHTYWGF